jgi:hypothetical protein
VSCFKTASNKERVGEWSENCVIGIELLETVPLTQGSEDLEVDVIVVIKYFP